MKEEIFFSIIIPTYNREKKLINAINSVINQTYKNWELIIVDNQSIDDSKKIVESLNNDKIFFYEIKNEGIIAKSRNYGISKSRGEYLCFLDSDDWWKPSKLEITYNFIKKGYKFLYHNMRLTKDGNFFKRKVSYCRYLKKPIYYDLIENGPAFPTSSVTLQKKIFNQIGQFDEKEDIVTWEDFDAWIRFAKINQSFIYLPKTLGYLRIDNDNFLNEDKSIKNIFSFKNKYLGKRDFPIWCIFSLVRSYIIKKDYINAKSFKKLININSIDFKLKVRLILLKLYLFFVS